MMNKKLTAAAVVVPVLAASLWMYKRAEAKDATTYRVAAVQRGDIKSTVSATGALSAVRTVQVGTQVSGQVAQILADFNQHVKKGQLIARIDPVLQQQAVADAQTGVERAQAQLAAAKADYDRNKQLHDAKIITDAEFSTYESTYQVDVANAKSAQIALEKAQQNLGYTNIYAPIDGVIVERDVDVGQTVAASLSAPQLFLIANDLANMQILASVDESDIGQIKTGQPVTFTVQTYPNQTFNGTVTQVRLQSKTTDNVVNYTVVVAVDNSSQKLLPGMTATLQFQTATASNVLEVPNAALRYRPSPDELAKAGVTLPSVGSGSPRDSTRAPRAAAGAPGGAASGRGAWNGGANGSQHGARTNVGMIWTVDASGKPAPQRVRLGLSDGQNTQVDGKNLTQGMQVIIGTASPGAAAAPVASSPFGGPQRGPGGMGRGF